MPATSLPDGPLGEGVLGPAGDVAGIDVDEHRRALAQLADAEARFSSAFENSGMGMTITSLEGRYVRVNPAFARMVGRSVAELVGMHVQEVTHPEDVGREARGDQGAWSPTRRSTPS